MSWKWVVEILEKLFISNSRLPSVIWNRSHDALAVCDHVCSYMEVFSQYLDQWRSWWAPLWLTSRRQPDDSSAGRPICHSSGLHGPSSLLSAPGLDPLRWTQLWVTGVDGNTPDVMCEKLYIVIIMPPPLSTSRHACHTNASLFLYKTPTLSHPAFLSVLFYLSRQPFSFAKRWKAPIGSDPVLRMKISGVDGDMSL